MLAARVLGDAGPPVVLLHGLTASNRYWGAAFEQLAADSRLIVPDLLGFGASPHPPTGYGPAEHATAVAGLLSELHTDDRPALVAGHSTGCLVALHLVHERPDLVGGVIAFAPPLYESRQQAEQHIASLGVMARMLSLDTRTAHTVCRWVCDHRAFAGRASVLFRPDLPAPIARDGVQHTWASYSETLEQVILSADAVRVVEAASVPVRFVIGEDDPVPDREVLERLARQNDQVSLTVWPDCDHNLLLTELDLAVDELRNAIAALPATRPCGVRS